MTGTVSKGNRLQNLARKALEREGYTVHVAVRTSQRRGGIWMSQSNDIFNAFDIIAVREDRPRPLRFIQVTTADHVSARIKKVEGVPIPLAQASVEVWGYVGGRKRLDRRFKTERVWLPRNYFQVYSKQEGWRPLEGEEVFPLETPSSERRSKVSDFSNY